MKREWLILFFLLTSSILFSQDTTQAKKVFIPKYERTKGYVGWVEAGINILPLLPKNSTSLYPLPSIRIFNGARLNRMVILGLETGLDFGAQWPVAVKVQIHGPLKIKAKKLGIFADFAAGYSYTWIYDNYHGFNFSPSVGFKVPGKRAAFTFRAGYYGLVTRELYRQNSPGGGVYIDPSRKANYYYNGIQIMTGVEF